MTLPEFLDLLLEAFKMPVTYLLSPGKRIYFWYLVSSAILAYYVYKKSKQKNSFFSYLFEKKNWLGKSPFIDYSFIFFNSIIKVFFIAPFLIYTIYLSLYMSDALTEYFGTCTLKWSHTIFVALYTLCIVVVNDFASFITHYLMHKIPFLWKFHKIHHSATVLNPLTQYRIHPIELIINNGRGIIIKGLITGWFMYLANGQIQFITFFGINILNFIFLFWGANLRHSHIRLKYFDFLETIFISPYQHQIHHSNDSKWYDTNMGSRLAIWDYMFGTLVKSKSVKRVNFGLGQEDKNYDSFIKNLISPFKAREDKNTNN